jgi:hypothetical protein
LALARGRISRFDDGYGLIVFVVRSYFVSAQRTASAEPRHDLTRGVGCKPMSAAHAMSSRLDIPETVPRQYSFSGAGPFGCSSEPV